ncbi:MAG: hypothetical protein FWF49_02810 [Oscillospiraceae bacterium]|nr:hypothetical protein [Oscillospiraceae bacterium]
MKKYGNKHVTVNFFIWSSFQYETHTGSYYLLLEYGDYKKLIEKHNVKGASNSHLILLGVIEGLNRMKRPAEIIVYSNPLLGITHIYNKDGTLREKAKAEANFKDKEMIRALLQKGKHHMKNIYDEYAKQKIMDERMLYT